MQLKSLILAGVSLAATTPLIKAEDDVKPQVLIITNSAEDESHAFIKKALAPSRRSAEFAVSVAQPSFLAEQSLNGFATIFIHDVARLSQPQLDALQARVKSGGGVCFLLGPNTDVDHYNRALHDKGQGIFPLPLAEPAEVPQGKTGIVAEKHPLLEVFAGDGQAMLDIVLVTRCHLPAADWRASDTKALSVIARSQNGNPIAVSKPYGDGTVVAFLFVPDRRWANWHFYPAWVVMLHELQKFLTEY